ncbi:MAG: hypothetical protein GY711_34630 [bacterium]|nr:hypothetical protein [bacterium]
MKRLVCTLASLATVGGTALCADVQVTVTGAVVVDNYTSGPLSAAQLDDTVQLTFAVDVSGSVIVPGQQTEYSVDLSTFDIAIDGVPTGAAFWSSDDITQILGTYDVAANLASFHYTIQGGGSVLEIFPDVLDLTGPAIGTSYCGPPFPNSSGLAATISATGSAAAAASLLILTAQNLPPGEFGYFLGGQTQGFSAPPGSQGIICLSGNIGRFNQASQVIQGPTGSTDVDLTAIPVNPPEAVMAGQSWNFQCWYRDSNPGPTSNFTNAVSVGFY